MSITRKFAADDEHKNIEVFQIINNLRHILNTKKGYGHFIKEFGIGDYNNYRSRQKVLETITQEIKQNIQLYEPRVELVDIKQVESDVAFRLRFELKCVIKGSTPRPLFIIFDSAYSRISVED